MLLGCARYTKGYKVLDLENGTTKISRSIELDEREASSIYEGNPVDLHPRTIQFDKMTMVEINQVICNNMVMTMLKWKITTLTKMWRWRYRVLLLTSVTQFRDRQAIMILLEA